MKFIVFLALVGCVLYGQGVKAGGKFETAMNGLKTAGEMMENARTFMKNTKTSDIISTTKVPYHTSLAASYGNLNSESIKYLDEELKVMIAGTNRIMIKINTENPAPTFQDFASAMLQNALLEQMDQEAIFRNDIKQFGSFGLAGKGVDEKIIKSVATWFENLVQDTDVLAATKINIEDYGNIVAATDAAIENFETIFLKQKEVKRSIVDVGVLRYPDIDNPFFKLFRIRLDAYRKSFRVLMVQKDESGIKGTYEAMKFVPRKSVMDKLKADTLSKAAAEAESMFD